MYCTRNESGWIKKTLRGGKPGEVCKIYSRRRAVMQLDQQVGIVINEEEEQYL
jgi:hypothetical protein